MLRSIVAVAAMLSFALCGAMAEVRLSGRVANENDAPVGGAKLVFRVVGGEADFICYADPSGLFETTLPSPGEYIVDVERLGHFALTDNPINLADGDNEANFTLTRVHEVRETIEVVAAPPPIDLDTTTSKEMITGTQILNIPYPTTNDLRNALRMIPGVVQGNNGSLHLNGGEENQALYTLDGFNITDPLTGRFETRLSVEAVQSVDVSGALSSVEYGKGSAGVLAISSKTGDDKFRVSATNFFPGVEYRKNLDIGNWTPRFNFSGPIRRGRAWFSNSFDTQYTNTVIEELPKGEDHSASWRLSNHLSTQVNLTPSNILYTGFLLNYYTAPRYGLGVLDPRETTIDQRRRQWFFHIKDQAYFRDDWLLEFGFAANRTFGREIPQGHDYYQLTPDGRSGNYFLDATRKSARDQLLVNTFLPRFELAGEHRVKIGMDLNRLQYSQNAERSGIETFDQDYNLTRRTVFRGNGETSLINYEASFYLQDSWRLLPGLLVEGGLRGDWDQILHYWSASPRVGAAWSPPGLERTKLSGGYGVVHDATNLAIFTRPMDQYSLNTYFGADGDPVRGPAMTVFTAGHRRLPRPRYQIVNLGFEQEWGGGVHTHAEYLRKRGRFGFTYVNTLNTGDITPRFHTEGDLSGEFDAIYSLTNDRRDVYDAFRITVRQAIRKKYEWMVSYTRSRAHSNAVTDANIDEPVLVNHNVGPMPWDTPNRVLSRGYLPTPFKNWAAAYLLEWRTGFPYSIISNDGHVIGDVNSARFPGYFELNLHLERRFVYRKYLWAFRAGCNNLTNHGNPNVVNNHAGSNNFLQFYGGADRSYNFRIRWLGKAAK